MRFLSRLSQARGHFKSLARTRTERAATGRLAAALIVACAALAAEDTFAFEKAPTADSEGRVSPSAVTLLPTLAANARIALFQGRPDDALRIWLLQNAVSAHARDAGFAEPARADLLSSTWAALGETGLCIESLATDDDGAGIWPIAAHNHLVRNFNGRPERAPPDPFLAFDSGQQRREVQARSVLSSAELKSITFQRGSCKAVGRTLAHVDQEYGPLAGSAATREKRLHNARALRELLVWSRASVKRDRLASFAPVESRIFSLELFLASASSDPEKTRTPKSLETRSLLERASRWSPQDWMALDSEGRLLLFPQVKDLLPSQEARETLIFAILDELSKARKGAEAETWIAFLSANDLPQTRKAVWANARGAELLALDAGSGFRERASISLHRGIDFAERGEMPEALRAIAYALSWADESREAEAMRQLSRRWIAYLAGHYRVEAALLSSLRQVLPREDFHFVLQELLWRAALRSDKASYNALSQLNTGRSAAAGRLARLSPLARGNLGAFNAALKRDLAAEPFATRKFAQDFVEQIEREEARVRRRLLSSLLVLQSALAGLVEGAGGNAALFAGELLPRCDALIRGLRSEKPAENPRTLAPDATVFAGNVRIAPTDAVRWPFAVPASVTPSVFTPLKLTPWDKPLPDGTQLAAWKVGEP